MKASLVTGVWMRNDAISDVVTQELSALAGAGVDDAVVYAYSADRGDARCRIVPGPNAVLFDPHFQHSELVIFHFGVHYPLFDALAATPRRARRVVVFHNITPKAHVGPEQHALIDRSFAQLSNAGWADHVLCDSETNLDVLRSCGIAVPATVNPLAFGARMQAPESKPSFDDGVVRIAFVGRLVRSKGPHELLEAVAGLLSARPQAHLRVDLIGNLHFSDPRIVAQVRRRAAEIVARNQTRIAIEVMGNASDATKTRTLRDADLFVLPTYHEGFCVPILESFASGCRVVAYDNSNTPFVSGGLGNLVATGDVARLTSALVDEFDRTVDPVWKSGPGGYRDHADRVARHIGNYSTDRFEARFVEQIERILGRRLRSRNFDAALG